MKANSPKPSLDAPRPVAQVCLAPNGDTAFAPRVLIVDDNPAIHDDFRKILVGGAEKSHEQDTAKEPSFFTTNNGKLPGFNLDSAYQGEEALARVRSALRSAKPYAVAFVGVRMPPGIDALETTTQLLREDPNIQIVILGSPSAQSAKELPALGESDRVVVLKKPVDAVEVQKLAASLGKKWLLAQQAAFRIADLERMVQARTAELRSENEALRREMVESRPSDAEPRLAQEHEAMGQLTGGIAHEINTPMQYIGDNVAFATAGFADFLAILRLYRQVRDALAGVGSHEVLLEKVKQAEEDLDLAYLEEQMPKALEQAAIGVKRVSQLVRAMKAFSYPEQPEKVRADVNQALEDTLAIAQSKVKYVADVETKFGDVPPILCHIRAVNRVFLSLIINAAHAIEDLADKAARGKIYIETALDNDKTVLITIRDTGYGVSEETIGARVFESLCGTKANGQRTRQGLAHARSVVTSHGGSLTSLSEAGRGTTFFIRLPLDGADIDSSHPKEPKA